MGADVNIEIHQWDVHVNGIEYRVTIAAEDNIAFDFHITSYECTEYPYDKDILFSFLYECAALEGDVREYDEWIVGDVARHDSVAWGHESKVKIECLSFEMSDAEIAQ